MAELRLLRRIVGSREAPSNARTSDAGASLVFPDLYAPVADLTEGEIAAERFTSVEHFLPSTD